MTTTSQTSIHLVPASEPDADVKITKAEARGRSWRKVIGVVFAGIVLASSGHWYWATIGHESTDNAQVDAEVVAVSTRTAGMVYHVYFTENQVVKVGEVLATLDDDVATARLAQAKAALESARAAADAAEADARVAEANARGNKAASDASVRTSSAAVSVVRDQIAEADAARASAEASLRQAKMDVERSRMLHGSGAISKAALDQSETSFAMAESNADSARARLVTLKSGVAQASGRVAEASARAHQMSDVDSYIAQARARASAARAQVGTAQAAVDLAALDVSFTRIVAPHDGVVSKKTIAEGQAVAAGQPVVQLVRSGLWVTANFKETQLARMRAGQPVKMSVDAFPKAMVTGEVESFSGGTGSRFTLLPPDNASGNYTKVVQRVPVRIRLVSPPEGVPLRPGMSVDVDVDTRG
jgi:membrane fusion protein (multidrug efflux system)